MEKFFEDLYYQFGNNLKSIEIGVARKNSEEDKCYDELEKVLNKKQMQMFDEFLLAYGDSIYEENLHSFISGLKLGLKLLKLDGAK